MYIFNQIFENCGIIAKEGGMHINLESENLLHRLIKKEV